MLSVGILRVELFSWINEQILLLAHFTIEFRLFLLRLSLISFRLFFLA